MSDVIGEFVEKKNEMRCEWRISNFKSLTKDVNRVYSSSMFFFSDASWCLKIYPNGRTEGKSQECIGVYLCRLDSGPQKSVCITIGIKRFDGIEENFWDENRTFDIRKHHEIGRAKFLRKSQLQNREYQLVPSGALTLICTLKSGAKNSPEDSLFRRLWNLSLSFKNMLSSGKRCDVVLKLKDGRLGAHKIILESRSPTFDTMFGVDMQESQTGEVNVKDADVDAFKVLLSYAYSGEPEGLSAENVYEVYKVAHKYDFQELRKLCSEVIYDHLSMQNICDVIAFAKLYEDKKLWENASDYFAKNKGEIFKTENWKRFKREDPETGFELLETTKEDTFQKA